VDLSFGSRARDRARRRAHEVSAGLAAKRARAGFEALFSNGTVSAERQVGGFDLFDFAPTEYPDFKVPGDYQGTSGGAVWRIYLKVNGEKPEVAGARLWGVPYYQRKKKVAGTF
jgi:hypothetical protein